MPTYQYTCTDCGTPLEAVQSFSDAALTECTTCGGRLRKVFSAVGVVFKGSGFYKNDSRPASKEGAAKGETKAEGGSDKSSEKGSDKGSDKGADKRSDKGSEKKADKPAEKAKSPSGSAPAKAGASTS